MDRFEQEAAEWQDWQWTGLQSDTLGHHMHRMAACWPGKASHQPTPSNSPWESGVRAATPAHCTAGDTQQAGLPGTAPCRCEPPGCAVPDAESDVLSAAGLPLKQCCRTASPPPFGLPLAAALQQGGWLTGRRHRASRSA